MVCKLPGKLERAVKEYKSCYLQGEDTDVCAKHLKNRMRSYGARFLGEGAERMAFKFYKGCVVKVAINDTSTSANLIEASTWNELPHKVKSAFTPVSDVDRKEGWWLTMPYVKISQRGTYRGSVAQRVQERLSEMGVNCPDVRGWNTGTFNGRPVVVDYGSGMCRSGLGRVDLSRRMGY